MNFAKLLGLGKSIFGSAPAAEYCLNKRVLLPKFNEGKNPFAPKTAPARAASAADSEPIMAALTETPLQGKCRPNTGLEAEPRPGIPVNPQGRTSASQGKPALPTMAPKVESKVNLSSVAPTEKPPVGQPKSWTTYKGAQAQKPPPPYAFKPLPKPGAKSATKPAAQPPAKQSRPGWTTRLNPFRPPEPEMPPVAEQTQFALDSVKVVHNDLTDADVEVVPVKSHAQVPPAVLPPTRQAWEYLGEKLLKPS